MFYRRISVLVFLGIFFVSLTATAFAAINKNPGITKPSDSITIKLDKITVTSPMVGDKWLIGDGQGSRLVRWTYNGNVDEKFTIALQKGTAIVFKFPGEFSLDGSGKGNAGVTIPSSVPGGDGYQIVLASKGDPNIKGTSNAFSLLNLKVTSPKGGEVWYKGQTHNITWTSSGNLGSKVYIWLASEDLAFVRRIGEASITDKSFSWLISSDIERRTNYRIMLNNNASYLFGGDWGFFSPGIITVAEFVK